MTLLLDANAFLWFVWNDARLSAVAKRSIEDPANRKLVSAATCWEITIKVGLGKLQLGGPCDQYLDQQLAINRFSLLPIELKYLGRLEHLPLHHRDPFDRMLVCQALEDNLAVVSIDIQLDAYGVARIW
jgi:PIN domain nuclease of toxin-antitoxin system